MNSWMRIPLTKGESTVVDLKDFLWLSQWKWHCSYYGYAARRDKNNEMIYMSRLITNTPKGKETDHVSGDRLDNRRSNLRICNKANNLRNRGLRGNNNSGYPGVGWRPDRGKWRARILGRHLGYFDSKEEAFEMYKKASVKQYGQYARNYEYI